MNNSGRIPSLDGIRIAAVSLVIVGHFNGYATSILMGVFGVHVFFVLSGYLITKLLQDEHEREGRISLTAFYRRRCFRIFPAAYAYILLVAIFSTSSRRGIIYALTYTVSYHADAVGQWMQHLWSLSVEEQFYLLCPLALIVGFRRRAAIAVGAVVIAAGFRVFLCCHPELYSLDRLHFSFLGTMDSIAAGCLLAIFEPQVKAMISGVKVSGLAAFTIPSAWLLFAGLWGHGKDSHSSAIQAGLWVLVPSMIAISVFLLVEDQPALLNNRAATLLGALSYSLYLWQQPFTIRSHFGTLTSIALLVACAACSYYLIEKPMLRLGRRSSEIAPIPPAESLATS